MSHHCHIDRSKLYLSFLANCSQWRRRSIDRYKVERN